jgi:CRP-like cAMP-binding protein
MELVTQKSECCFSDRFPDATQWRALGKTDLEWLNNVATCSSYQPGQYIFYEGDACDGIHFIRHGLVGVRKFDADGESVLIHLAEEGDPLCYETFFADQDHYCTVEVLQPTRVCFLRARHVRELFHCHPALGFEFLRRASRDLGEARERFHQAVSMDLRLRLAHFLLQMKKRYGHITDEGKLLIELPVSRRDMAEMLGVRSESLSRMIRQLTDEGILTFSGRRVWLDTADLLIHELEPRLEQHLRH